MRADPRREPPRGREEDRPQGGRPPGGLRQRGAHPHGAALQRARAPGLLLRQAPRGPAGPRAARHAGAVREARQRRVDVVGRCRAGAVQPAQVPGGRRGGAAELPRAQRSRLVPRAAHGQRRHPAGGVDVHGAGLPLRAGPQPGGAGRPRGHPLLVADRRQRAARGQPDGGHARRRRARAGQRHLDHRLQPPEPRRRAHAQQARPARHRRRPHRGDVHRQRLGRDPGAPRLGAPGRVQATRRARPPARARGRPERLRAAVAAAHARHGRGPPGAAGPGEEPDRAARRHGRRRAGDGAVRPRRPLRRDQRQIGIDRRKRVELAGNSDRDRDRSLQQSD